MLQASFPCPNCKTHKLFTAASVNHIAHLLGSVFLCGLWLPIWALITIFHDPTYYCSGCGYPLKTRDLFPTIQTVNEHTQQNNPSANSSANSDEFEQNKRFWFLAFIVLSCVIVLIGAGFLVYNNATKKSVSITAETTTYLTRSQNYVTALKQFETTLNSHIVKLKSRQKNIKSLTIDIQELKTKELQSYHAYRQAVPPTELQSLHQQIETLHNQQMDFYKQLLDYCDRNNENSLDINNPIYKKNSDSIKNTSKTLDEYLTKFKN